MIHDGRLIGSSPRSFAIAIEISRLSNTKSKRTILIESRPCRPGWEDGAIFDQEDIRAKRLVTGSIAIARRMEMRGELG